MSQIMACQHSDLFNGGWWCFWGVCVCVLCGGGWKGRAGGEGGGMSVRVTSADRLHYVTYIYIPYIRTFKCIYRFRGCGAGGHPRHVLGEQGQEGE